MLYGLILVIHLFVCLVLIAVILLQAGRGGGFADVFGGAAQSIFGTRGTVYLTRATTVCAAVFMLTSISLAVLSAQRGRSLMERVAVPPQASQAPAESGEASPEVPTESSTAPSQAPASSSGQSTPTLTEPASTSPQPPAAQTFPESNQPPSQVNPTVKESAHPEA